MMWTNSASIHAILKYFLISEKTYQVMAQWRQIIYISQVSLSLLHSLHTAVYGPHQGLLGQTLTTTNNRDRA